MRKNGTTLHLRATSFPTSNNLELKAEDYEATNSAVFQVAVTNTLNAACQAKFGTEDNQITAYNDDKVLARFSSTLGDKFTSNDIEDILIQMEDLSKELDDEKNFFDITNAKYNECLTNFQEGEEWYKIFFLLCEAKKFTSSTAKGEALLEKVNNIVQEQGNIFENSIEIWNALRETEEFKNMVETYEKLWAINEAVIEQNNSFWLNLSDIGSITPYKLWVCDSKGYFGWTTDAPGVGAKTLTATAVLCPLLTLDASILTSQNGFVER